MRFSITSQIGIDMAHRVPTHGSKCRNLHGHRYTILATASADALPSEGESTGMVMDFSFLKIEMLNAIDLHFDHGSCFWIDDPLLKSLWPILRPRGVYHIDEVRKELAAGDGFVCYLGDRAKDWHKIAIVAYIPTAEMLAKLWYDILLPRVIKESGGRATLDQITVYETPNNSATYPAHKAPAAYGKAD